MALISCPDCQTDISDLAAACPKCGRPLVIQGKAKLGEKRFVGSLIVVGILGLVDLVGALMFSSPGIAQIGLIAAIPELATITLASPAIRLTGGAVLLIGVALSAMGQASGPRVVRITSGVMTIVWLFLGALTARALSGSVQLAQMEPATRGGIVGGVAGGIIGAVAEWALFWYLFRSSKWGR